MFTELDPFYCIFDDYWPLLSIRPLFVSCFLVKILTTIFMSLCCINKTWTVYLFIEYIISVILVWAYLFWWYKISLIFGQKTTHLIMYFFYRLNDWSFFKKYQNPPFKANFLFRESSESFWKLFTFENSRLWEYFLLLSFFDTYIS